MSNLTNKIDTSFATIIKVLALSVFGFGFNFVNFTLYATIHFIFGGIFVVFTILRFGLFWGVVCAFVSNISTYFLWGHPFAVLYFTFEALFVGYLYQKRGIHVVLGDIIYWLSLGAVLIYVVFNFSLGVEKDVIISVYLKCFLNGVFYCLISSMLNHALRIFEYYRGDKQKTLSIRYAFFETILIFIMIPAVAFFLYSSYRHANMVEDDIKQRLNYDAFILSAFLTKGFNDIANLETTINSLKKLDKFKDIYILITDSDGKTKYPNKQHTHIDDISGGDITQIGDGVMYWKPLNVPSELKAFQMSAYIKEMENLEGTMRIFLVAYVRDYIKSFSSHSNTTMLFTLALFIITSVLAYITSKIMLKPMQDLVEAGKSIPERIVSGHEINFPPYFIHEFDYMAGAMQSVLKELIKNFREINLHKHHLQSLVDERTIELKTARDHYKNITENISDIVYRLRVRPKISLEYINPAVIYVLGYTPDELLGDGKKILGIIHPEDKSRFKESLLDTGKYNIITLRWISRDGKTKYLEHKNTYHFDENARLISVEGIARDITERRRLAELFRESAKRFQVLFERAPYAILIIDKQSAVILDANAQAEVLFKNKRLNFIGKDVHSIFHLRDAGVSKEKTISTLSQDGEYREYDIIRTDGKIIPVGIMSSVIEIEGKQALCSVFRDITARKKYEQDMKDALKEKELLIREIHHRVKNNLQVILSLINIQSSLTNDEKTRAMLSDLDNRIKSISIVHESLYQSPDLSHIDLKEYINKLVNSLNNVYGRYDIKLTVSCDNIIIPFEQAIKIGLIINEMVSNSFKHAFKDVYNGYIDIQAFMIDNNRLRIRVYDNGIGIDEDILNKKTGSLGFQIINMLVRQLSGELNIKSDKGTDISITLTLNQDIKGKVSYG